MTRAVLREILEVGNDLRRRPTRPRGSSEEQEKLPADRRGGRARRGGTGGKRRTIKYSKKMRELCKEEKRDIARRRTRRSSDRVVSATAVAPLYDSQYFTINRRFFSLMIRL